MNKIEFQNKQLKKQLLLLLKVPLNKSNIVTYNL